MGKERREGPGGEGAPSLHAEGSECTVLGTGGHGLAAQEQGTALPPASAGAGGKLSIAAVLGLFRRMRLGNIREYIGVIP